MSLLRIDSHKLDARPLQEQVEVAEAFRSVPGLDHDRAFDEGRRGQGSGSGRFDGFA